VQGSPTERALWLAEFVMPCEPALRRWLSRHRVPGLDVDDIIQETYAILTALPSVAEIRNAKKYTFQTAYSIILAYLRRARIVSITTVADVEHLGVTVDAPSPESEVGDREELRNVGDVVAALPKRVREVFILRRMDGLSQREVSQRLGISENAVEKCVARGVQALMSAFQRGGKPPLNTPRREQEPETGSFLPKIRGKKSV
jgi:RNA polymerase sigma-70 factor (ECF subfamily)